MRSVVLFAVLLTAACKDPAPPPPPTPQPQPQPQPQQASTFPSPAEALGVAVPEISAPTRAIAAGVGIFADAKGMRIAARDLKDRASWLAPVEVVALREDLSIPPEVLPSPILAAPLQQKLQALLAEDPTQSLGGRVAVFAHPDAPVQLIYQSVNTAAHTGLRNHDLGVRTSDGSLAALHSYVPLMGTCRTPKPHCIQAGVALGKDGHVLQIREAPLEAACRTYSRVRALDEVPLPELNTQAVMTALGTTQAPPAGTKPCTEAFITTPPSIPWGDVVAAAAAVNGALRMPTTLGPPLRKPPKSTEILQGLKEMRRVPLPPQRGQQAPNPPL